MSWLRSQGVSWVVFSLLRPAMPPPTAPLPAAGLLLPHLRPPAAAERAPRRALRLRLPGQAGRGSWMRQRLVGWEELLRFRCNAVVGYGGLADRGGLFRDMLRITFVALSDWMSAGTSTCAVVLLIAMRACIHKSDSSG